MRTEFTIEQVVRARLAALEADDDAPLVGRRRAL